jgi:hypothetical protein
LKKEQQQTFDDVTKAKLVELSKSIKSSKVPYETSRIEQLTAEFKEISSFPVVNCAIVHLQKGFMFPNCLQRKKIDEKNEEKKLMQ